MGWQLFLIGYLVLGVSGYLLRRTLAHSLAIHNRLVNGFFFIVTLYPTGLIVALFMHPHLGIGWQNLAFLLIGSTIFPIANVLAYRANNEVDAGLYTILNNLKPLVTITTAWMLLHEKLAGHQILGAAVIVSSSFLVTLPNLKHHLKSKHAGLALALMSIGLVGAGTTYERFMLTRMDFGAYLVFGWGAQALWMAILAWPERKHVHLLRSRKNLLPVLAYSIGSSLKGLFFLAALKLSGSASIVSASGSFMAILVVLAAYVTLKEKGWIWLKICAALAGAGGLIILGSS
jgi:drug/metabolite transporter (DMT)-like permease